MNSKIFVRIFSFTALCMVISSCGDDKTLGGNVTEFKTSIASASAATPRLEADLITGNTCTDGVTTGGTISTETVDFTIKTTSTASGTSTPLPIAVNGYTITFTPKNAGTPALTSITNPANNIITAGSSITIPVEITTDRQKIDLIGANPSLVCSLNIFQYDVMISFHAAEVGSGDGSKNINAFLVLAMADRNN